ncbi:hypothetical protein CONLIGDRAFT_684364 [Coniochaeta ligniaria NRRL 30616]|uniref:Uncharacterized protein n=1 Tax=Coniochaeta ligniaria NRRL 30616 TaxID=1408157 RepID=A0A1J7JE27_9PEZI|nr:hypothetical protein CONLIGDRAFT_684364 [Coniochaeta ligniaria NRRL 30616]
MYSGSGGFSRSEGTMPIRSRQVSSARLRVSSTQSPVEDVGMNETDESVDGETAESPNTAIESVSDSDETTTSADETDDDNNEDSSSEEGSDDGDSEEDGSDEDDWDEDDYNLIVSVRMGETAPPAEFDMALSQHEGCTIQDLYLLFVERVAHHYPGSYRGPFTLENTLGTLSARHKYRGPNGRISWLGEWNVELDGVPLDMDFFDFVGERMEDYLYHTGGERRWFSLDIKVPLVEGGEERPVFAEVNWT